MSTRRVQQYLWIGKPCCYCGQPLDRPRANTERSATWDHEVARCYGGDYKVVSCWKCNQMKGALPLEIWPGIILKHRNYVASTSQK